MTALCLCIFNNGNTEDVDHEITTVENNIENDNASNGDENTSEKLIDFFKNANSSVLEEVKKFKLEIEGIINSIRNNPEYKRDEQNGERISAEADNIVQSIGSVSEILDGLNKNFDALSELLNSIKTSIDVLKEGKFPDEQSAQFEQTFKNMGAKIINIYGIPKN